VVGPFFSNLTRKSGPARTRWMVADEGSLATFDLILAPLSQV
jgi:hypothetical protein